MSVDELYENVTWWMSTRTSPALMSLEMWYFGYFGDLTTYSSCTCYPASTFMIWMRDSGSVACLLMSYTRAVTGG